MFKKDKPDKNRRGFMIKNEQPGANRSGFNRTARPEENRMDFQRDARPGADRIDFQRSVRPGANRMDFQRNARPGVDRMVFRENDQPEANRTGFMRKNEEPGTKRLAFLKKRINRPEANPLGYMKEKLEKDEKTRKIMLWIFEIVAALIFGSVTAIGLFQSVSMQESSMEPTLSVDSRFLMNRVSGKHESVHNNLPGIEIDIGEIAYTVQIPAHTQERSGKADPQKKIRKNPDNLFCCVNYLFRHCPSFSRISLQIRIYEDRNKKSPGTSNVSG